MILAFRRQRQMDLCETSLIYTLNSRLARGIVRPCQNNIKTKSKQNKTKKNKKPHKK